MGNAASTDAAPGRLWSLDVLRGLCAGVVFLSHWHLWCDFAPRGAIEEAIRRFGDIVHDLLIIFTWPTGGHHPAVLAFFVLSGFCIHYPFERRALAGAAEPSWRSYFSRRLRRIMPVYWAACALGVVFVIAQTHWPSGSQLHVLHAIAAPEDFAVRFVGLAGIYPREIFAGNYILTTVTVEIIMYAAYPLFYRRVEQGRWREMGFTFFALHVIAILLLKFFTPYWVFNSIFMLGIFWYAGAFASHLFLTGRAKVGSLWLLLAWIVFLGLKALPPFTGLNLLKQAAWGLVCTLGILWVVQLERRHPAWGSRRWIGAGRWLGEISYSLYAMHTPALMLASWMLLRLGLRDYGLQLIATMIAALAATLAVHYGVEKVFYRPSSDTGSTPPRATPTETNRAAVG